MSASDAGAQTSRFEVHVANWLAYIGATSFDMHVGVQTGMSDVSIPETGAAWGCVDSQCSDGWIRSRSWEPLEKQTLTVRRRVRLRHDQYSIPVGEGWLRGMPGNGWCKWASTISHPEQWRVKLLV